MKRSELFFGFAKLPLDIAMIILAFVLAYYVRIDLEVVPALSDIGLKNYLSYSLYLIPFWILLFALNGLYSLRSNTGFRQNFYKILNASSTAMLALVVGIFFSRSLFFSRLILGFSWIFSIITISLGRIVLSQIHSALFKYGIGLHNVILIGNNSASENVFKYYTEKPKLGFRVCGVLDEEKVHNSDLKILGKIEDFENIIKSYQIDEVILTDTRLPKSKILELIEISTDHNISFKYVPDILAILTSNVTTGLIGSMPVMELHPTPLDGWSRIGKRILDILFSLFAIILFSPIYLLVSLGVKLTSRGPLIYKHKRVGRDGKVFNFYKFRSMYAEKCDYEEGGSQWSTRKDETARVTPFGKFLRKTSLDEIPQFVNVIKGDMSFVGPRPEQPKFVEQFQKEIPEYFKRHRVRSGITGWAQVNGLKGDTSIRDRVRYDIYYIENWSIWFDLLIILKTIRLIIKEAFGDKVEYTK